MPEDWREYSACRLFDLTPESYAAMPWQKTEMWFRFHNLEVAAIERQRQEAQRRRR